VPILKSIAPYTEIRGATTQVSDDGGRRTLMRVVRRQRGVLRRHKTVTFRHVVSWVTNRATHHGGRGTADRSCDTPSCMSLLLMSVNSAAVYSRQNLVVDL